MENNKPGRGRPPKAANHAAPAGDSSLPDFIREAKDTMEGFEGIDTSTMSIPFIKIAQPLSPQINPKKTEYIDGLQAGQFFNSVSKAVYGETLEVIVLAFERLFIEWQPDRGGFVAAHNYENAERLAVTKDFGKWKTKSGNDLQENYTYFALVCGREKEGIAVLSLTSTNIPAAKAWNRRLVSTVMTNGEKARPFYLRWTLSTVYAENEKGSWYKVQADMAGYIDEVQYSIVKPERLALPNKSVDYAQIEGPAAAPAGGPAPSSSPDEAVDEDDPFAAPRK